MTDQETIARFIFLRSQGMSFNDITVQLGVSKPTLIKWSRQHQFEIQNLRATETEAERVSTAIAISGISVTPMPALTICTKVDSELPSSNSRGGVADMLQNDKA